MDIRGPFTATLDALGFEGVTKRSRPNLVPGDLVYARVKAAARDADPEIICTDATGKVGLKYTPRDYIQSSAILPFPGLSHILESLHHNVDIMQTLMMMTIVYRLYVLAGIWIWSAERWI